ncbi:MAG: sigma-70 family RNA polymerase sigma factor [Planctomycetota bacterium]
MRLSMTHEAEVRAPGDLLQANLEWIRALARALARDPHAADELAQDACVAALEAPAGEIRSFRPWLASVMRNLWRQRGRSEERRRVREADAGGEGAREDLVLQVVVFRELAQHVLELHEPYRSALLMRYFEDLPPRAIAARLGTTPATIQNRITRGLAILRERLDRSRGGRQAWLAALVPLIDRPMPWIPLTLGGIAVNTKLIVAGAALVAVGALVALGAIERGDEKAEVPARAGVALETPIPAPEAEDSPLLGSRAAPAERAPVSSPESEEARPADAVVAAKSFAVRGRVLDVEGAPLEGLAIGTGGQNGGTQVARSGPGGWFELTSEADSGRYSSADPAWTTVRSAAWSAGSQLEPLLLVARALDVEGIVQDPRGMPLASARVRLNLPSGLAARFDRPLEASVGLNWATVAGPDGRFALRGIPAVEGAKLTAVLEGYASGEVPEPAFADAGVTIVLAPPAKPLTGGLKGRVVDDGGRPVPQARVFLGLASVTTDAQGEFALGFSRAVTTDRIVAIAAGWRPAAMDRPREPRGEDTGWPESVELALPGPVLSIRGRVVDAEGEPVAGLRVCVADPSPVGAIGSMPVHAEYLGAGGTIPAQALESESRMPEEDGDNFQDWAMLVGPANAFFHYVTTNSDGEFELSGLDERRYDLALQDPKTCSRTTSKGHLAGGGMARIVWEPPPLIPLVAGRVLGGDGKPIAGARIGLSRQAFGVRSRVFGGRVDVALHDRRDRATTGEDGSFEFRDVPPEGLVLNVNGEGIIPDGFPVVNEGDPAALTLRVHQRCSFEVVVTSGQIEADEIALRDGEGKPLDVLVIDSEQMNAYTSTELTEGRSGVVSASSAAATLELRLDGVTVHSVPIRLSAGEVTRIEI